MQNGTGKVPSESETERYDISIRPMTNVVGRKAVATTLVIAFVCVSVPAAYAQAADGSKNRFFRGLATGIEFYRKIADAGGWPTVHDGTPLKVGVSNPRVPVLRQRLSMTGDYIGSETDSPIFDGVLKAAVIAYQTRNGGEPDGVAGKGTIASLNVPVEKRIRQMELNRERWARTPASLGKRFVLVNMAGFELNVIEGEKSVLSMRVVVGKNYHSTPMFSDTIKFIEFNPYWNVPASIATKELVPDYARGTGKAQKQGFEIVRGEEAAPVTSVKWSNWVGKEELPFRIRQRPGPTNALGEMKFMFPNKHNVYLHDTNARGLFAKTVRAFSHGCVRLQKPRELATYLLVANGDMPRQRIDEIVASGEHTTVNLTAPIPVHLAYMTTWLDWKGILQFRPDIYGRDAALGLEMSAVTPAAPAPGSADPLAGSIETQADAGDPAGATDSTTSDVTARPLPDSTKPEGELSIPEGVTAPEPLKPISN